METAEGGIVLGAQSAHPEGRNAFSNDREVLVPLESEAEARVLGLAEEFGFAEVYGSETAMSSPNPAFCRPWAYS